MRFRVSHNARDDLDEIWHFIALDNVDAADRVLDKIENVFALIGRSRQIGVARENFGKGLRMFPHGPYLIFYRIEHDQVLILRVIHAARDIDHVFLDNPID